MEASDTQIVPPGFHVGGEGLSFRKKENGVVEVRIAESAGGAGSVRYMLLGPMEWASVVCHVSAEGETEERWKQATDFHGAGYA